MPRKGRPRKNGAPRRRGRLRRPQADQRPSRDPGTDELVARRLILAKGGDPAKTSHPLDYLHMRGILTDDQMRAGLHYAWLHSLVHQRPQHALIQRYGQSLPPARLDDERWLAERQAELRNAQRKLPSPQLNAVYVTAILCEMPGWLNTGPQMLIKGLSNLAHVFGRVSQAA